MKKTRIILAAIGALILLIGAAQRIFSGGLPFVRGAHQAAATGSYFRHYRNGFVLQRGNIRLSFSEKKRQATVNGQKIGLGYAPILRYNHWYLSEIDYQTTVLPLLNPTRIVRPRRIQRILLDPGHGGKDRGAAGRFSCEKNLTLAIARRTATILRRCGYDVRLTRNSDYLVPLNQRARNLKAKGVDLFVSIHFNAARDRSISGIETFCLAPANTPSSNSGKPSRVRYAGNYQDADNFLLAWNIQRELLKRTRAVDRGVKRSRFAVLRDAQVPAVLVELGFISNRSEERNVNSRNYSEQLARGLAVGIIAYHHALRRR